MLAFLYTWEIDNTRCCPQPPNLQKHRKPRVQHSNVVRWFFPVALAPVPIFWFGNKVSFSFTGFTLLVATQSCTFKGSCCVNDK